MANKYCTSSPWCDDDCCRCDQWGEYEEKVCTLDVCREHEGMMCQECRKAYYLKNPEKCKHEYIENNMCPDTCRDCGKVLIEEKELTRDNKGI